MLLFNNPSALFLSVVLLALVYWVHFYKKRGGRLILSFKIWKVKVYRIGSYWPKFLSGFTHVLFWLGFGLFILALADPALTTTQKIYLNKGFSTMVVLDESPSMAARDFGAESRFESAKTAIKNFIASRENDEIGLITFSKEAALRVPLSNDYRFFIDTLDRVQIMELGNGTSIGLGLAMATLHLNESEAKQKNIILITDGANNSGEIHPDAAIDVMVALGIKVYTVGLGRKGIKDIRFTDPSTGQLIRAEINDESYDEKLLRLIAERTGGNFYRAETFASFDALFRNLDAQSSGEHRYKLSTQSHSYRLNCLALAFILVVLALALRSFVLREVL